MTIEELLKDKSIKAKAKVAQIGEWILKGSLSLDELLSFAEKQNGSDKGSCVEAIEYATKKNPKVADESIMNFMTKALIDEEPRVKWESAKVIANIAGSHTTILDAPIKSLIKNTSHSGTVVRWATAFALGEILKLKTKHNTKLLPVIEKLSISEKENGVKKKYLEALKKVKK